MRLGQEIQRITNPVMFWGVVVCHEHVLVFCCTDMICVVSLESPCCSVSFMLLIICTVISYAVYFYLYNFGHGSEKGLSYAHLKTAATSIYRQKEILLGWAPKGMVCFIIELTEKWPFSQRAAGV